MKVRSLGFEENPFQQRGKLSANNRKKFAVLKTKLEEIQALSYTRELLYWDSRVTLPKGKKTVDGRAWVTSKVEGLIHERSTSTQMGELVSELSREEILSSLSPVDRKIVEQAKRDYEHKTKLDQHLVEELASTGLKANAVWEEARGKNDFKALKPYLEKMFKLQRKKAEQLGYKDSPYDALHDEYEREMTSKKLEVILGRLRDELIPLIAQIKDSGIQPRSDIFKYSYSDKEQLELGEMLLRHVKYNGKNGRLDLSKHPFTSYIGPYDSRITTRLDEHDFLSNISSVLHEAGHGIHGLKIHPKLLKTNVGMPPSLGICESQSRFVENLLGKNMAFWEFFYPKLQNHFKPQLKDVSLEDFYKIINKVEPSLIRIEADEATYNLHIIIRFELEKALIEGNLQVQDLPAAWNEKYEKYLGIVPPNDKDGVMQDMHWPSGAIGYFPTYTLGNLYAAQFYRKADEELGGIDDILRSGDLTPIIEWNGNNINQHGLMLTAEEVAKKATGETLNPFYGINHLKHKFGELYSLD